MTRIRLLLVGLLVVGPSLVAPFEAEASGGTRAQRQAPIPTRAPSVACSVVAWPEGGAVTSIV